MKRTLITILIMSLIVFGYRYYPTLSVILSIFIIPIGLIVYYAIHSCPYEIENEDDYTDENDD